MTKPSYQYLFAIGLALIFAGCTVPTLVRKDVNKEMPIRYATSQDTTNIARIRWADFFKDPHLKALIDTALRNNQELNIMLQEMEIAKNEVSARKGEYLPFVDLTGAAEVEKAARYTQRGSSEATTEIKPGKETPEPLPDFLVGAFARWEVDIWHKLRNARKAAAMRYLATAEGKNFMVTHLIAEIANAYYELLALDNQLAIIQQNIQIQTDVLEIMKLQKQAARVTELAVRRFQAQLLNTTGLQYDIQQRIVEIENRINFLVGRYPQHVDRDADGFIKLVPDQVYEGLPAQLLGNRPDVRQAEMQLEAARLDVKAAKANFYPKLGLSAAVGLQSYDPTQLFIMPESLLIGLAGDLTGPLINKRAIKAQYLNANAMQIQAIYHYEQTVLNAFIEVSNQLSMINNMERRYDLKRQEVEALNQSIHISNDLFLSARADYMEVLITQRDALESRFELVETKKRQMNALVNVYQALGGGWN
ncbi:MAG: TolC family protein [Cyclobacteriaceae bacterium]